MIETRSAKRKRTGCFRLVGFILLGVLLLVGGATFLLLGYSPVPAAAQHPFDLARMRSLAVESGQPLPVRLNAMIVADGAYPSALVAAGSGFQNLRMAFPTFQVVYADGAIVIDAPHDQTTHTRQFPGMPYSLDKYLRMQEAMRQSKFILATHEHFDHIGGLASSPYLTEIAPKIRLTPAQIDHTGPATGFTPATLAALTPLDVQDYTRVAPGVVLVAAPGHTPGSQMVYVRLQNGEEYLLAGDVVWNSLSLRRQLGRSWLASLILGENRKVHAQQVRALIDLTQGSSLRLLISHDGPQLDQAVQDGWVGAQFE